MSDTAQVRIAQFGQIRRRRAPKQPRRDNSNDDSVLARLRIELERLRIELERITRERDYFRDMYKSLEMNR